MSKLSHINFELNELQKINKCTNSDLRLKVTFEKRIRTKAWLEHIKIAGGFLNVSQIAKYMTNLSDPNGPDRNRCWGYYNKLEKLPRRARLNEVEATFKGTTLTYDDGPEESGLFIAMFGDLTALRKAEKLHHNFFWLFTIESEVEVPEEKRFSNTIKLLYSSTTKGNWKFDLPEICPSNPLNYFAGCVLILRAILTDQHSTDEEISNAFNLVLSTLRMNQICSILNSYGLDEMFEEWINIEIRPILQDDNRATPLESSKKFDNKLYNLNHISKILYARPIFWSWLNSPPPLNNEEDHDMYGLMEALSKLELTS